MDVTEARRRVKLIADAIGPDGTGDYEMAHASEDDLRRDFIRWASTCGHPDVETIAEVILQTEEIDFPRHCA